jgi:hypothetical protein
VFGGEGSIMEKTQVTEDSILIVIEKICTLL